MGAQSYVWEVHVKCSVAPRCMSCGGPLCITWEVHMRCVWMPRTCAWMSILWESVGLGGCPYDACRGRAWIRVGIHHMWVAALSCKPTLLAHLQGHMATFVCKKRCIMRAQGCPQLLRAICPFGALFFNKKFFCKSLAIN